MRRRLLLPCIAAAAAGAARARADAPTSSPVYRAAAFDAGTPTSGPTSPPTGLAWAHCSCVAKDARTDEAWCNKNCCRDFQHPVCTWGPVPVGVPQWCLCNGAAKALWVCEEGKRACRLTNTTETYNGTSLQSECESNCINETAYPTPAPAASPAPPPAAPPPPPPASPWPWVGVAAAGAAAAGAAGAVAWKAGAAAACLPPGLEEEEVRALERIRRVCSDPAVPDVVHLRVAPFPDGGGGPHGGLAVDGDGGTERVFAAWPERPRLSHEQRRLVEERVVAALAPLGPAGLLAVTVRVCPISAWTHDPYPDGATAAVSQAVLRVCAAPLVAAPADGDTPVRSVHITEDGHIVRFREGVRLTPAERNAVVAKYRARLPRRLRGSGVTLFDDAYREEQEAGACLDPDEPQERRWLVS